jgi:hypothetical protein
VSKGLDEPIDDNVCVGGTVGVGEIGVYEAGACGVAHDIEKMRMAGRRRGRRRWRSEWC